MKKKFSRGPLTPSSFVDIGRLEDAVILAGMGRSGTTWGADVINYDNRSRVMFEPFYPAMVSEARGFEYIQYLNPETGHDSLEKQAKSILTGKLRNKWVDRDNSRLLYRHRIVKDIRCNLMLGWLKRISPRSAIVMMIRHPLQVAASWKRLGWGRLNPEKRSDLEIIISQQDLLMDFSLIRDIVKDINPQDFIDRVVFQWCVYHFVPLHQLKPGDAYVLYYELMMTDPEQTVRDLFDYLNKPFCWDEVQKAMPVLSRTSCRKQGYVMDPKQHVEGWKTEFTDREIKRADSIVAAFGLKGIYDEHGCPGGHEILSF